MSHLYIIGICLADMVRDTFLLTEDPPSGTPSGPAATTRKGGYWSLQPGVSLETKEGANGETIWSVKK